MIVSVDQQQSVYGSK